VDLGSVSSDRCHLRGVNSTGDSGEQKNQQMLEIKSPYLNAIHGKNSTTTTGGFGQGRIGGGGGVEPDMGKGGHRTLQGSGATRI